MNYLPSKPITKQDLNYTKEVLVIIKRDLENKTREW